MGIKPLAFAMAPNITTLILDLVSMAMESAGTHTSLAPDILFVLM